MNETAPKTFVFVLMPFSDEFRDTYELGIKAACEAAGAYCERVDEQIFTENILDRLYNQIAKADIIVADMTGRNANVFYETGYAHALNKQVILLTRSTSDIPFDLRHYPHIIYEGRITHLKTELEKKIRWCVQNPKDALKNVDLNLEFSVDGIPISERPGIKVNNVNYCYFSIDIHNLTGKLIAPQSFDLALIIPTKVSFHRPKIKSATKLRSGEYLYALEHTNNIFPFGWHSISTELEFIKPLREAMEITLRFFTELGFQNYSFYAERG